MRVPRGGGPVGRRAPGPVVAGPGTAEGGTGPLAPDHGCQLVHPGVEHGVDYSSESALLEISSKSACTFPWTLMTASAWANLERSRSFSLRSLATSESEGPPRPPSLRPRAALISPWRCWRRQSVMMLE